MTNQNSKPAFGVDLENTTPNFFPTRLKNKELHVVSVSGLTEHESESFFSQPIAFRGHSQPCAEYPQYRGQYVTNVPKTQFSAGANVVTQQLAPSNAQFGAFRCEFESCSAWPNCCSTFHNWACHVLRIFICLGDSVHVVPPRKTSPYTPQAGYHTHCASVPSTQPHETEIVVYDSDPNHEVGASDPETCKQHFSPQISHARTLKEQELDSRNPKETHGLMG